MKSLICRQDSTRVQVVFLLDTLNHDTQTLEVWKGTPDAKTETVNVDYYRSTRSVSDADELLIAKKFVELFKIKDGIILRRRLYKSAPGLPGNKHPTLVGDEHTDKTIADMLEKIAPAIANAVNAAIKDAFKKAA